MAEEDREMEETGTDRKWWQLPFDATTNFSLLGYIISGLRWEDPRKRTDFNLEDD